MINLSNDEALGAAAIAAHKFSFRHKCILPCAVTLSRLQLWQKSLL